MRASSAEKIVYVSPKFIQKHIKVKASGFGEKTAPTQLVPNDRNCAKTTQYVSFTSTISTNLSAARHTNQKQEKTCHSKTARGRSGSAFQNKSSVGFEEKYKQFE